MKKLNGPFETHHAKAIIAHCTSGALTVPFMKHVSEEVGRPYPEVRKVMRACLTDANHPDLRRRYDNNGFARGYSSQGLTATGKSSPAKFAKFLKSINQ